MTEVPVYSPENSEFIKAFSLEILKVIKKEKPKTLLDEKSVVQFAMSLLWDYAQERKIPTPTSMRDLPAETIRTIALQEL